MAHDFLAAALPWICMGLFTAVACTWIGKKEK